jgi:predicted nucleotidyltransferase
MSICREIWNWINSLSGVDLLHDDKNMKTRKDILNQLREMKGFLSESFKVNSLALFGSYSRGDQTETSDVDILVDVDPSLGLEFVTLAEAIEAALGVSVDLVSSRAIRPQYKAAIEKELIYV